MEMPALRILKLLLGRCHFRLAALGDPKKSANNGLSFRVDTEWMLTQRLNDFDMREALALLIALTSVAYAVAAASHRGIDITAFQIMGGNWLAASIRLAGNLPQSIHLLQ